MGQVSQCASAAVTDHDQTQLVGRRVSFGLSLRSHSIHLRELRAVTPAGTICGGTLLRPHTGYGAIPRAALMTLTTEVDRRPW